MLKPFNELVKVEVKITKKPTFKYNKVTKEYEKQEGKDIDTLSWVDCLKTLYEQGAEKVEFEHVVNDNGGLLFIDENNCIHIKVYVEIDKVRREILYPVIDGSKDITLEKITQSDIYNAKQRAFVKCVAVNWGLGINLWTKDNDPEDIAKVDDRPNVYEYFRNLVNSASKQLGSVPEMLKHLQGMSEKKVKELLEAAKTIDSIEKTLEKVLTDTKLSEEKKNDKKQ